jgi:hypothetical protein
MSSLEMLTPDIFLRSIELVLNPSKKYLMPYTQVTLLTFDNSFTFKRGLNSDIYRIYISSNDETNFRTAVSYVEIVLTNNINVDYGHNISYQKGWGFTFKTLCRFNVIRNTTRVCPGSKSIISHFCNGSAGELYTACPNYEIKLSPSCNLFQVASKSLSSKCILHDYSPIKTICRCPSDSFLLSHNTVPSKVGSNSNSFSLDFVAVTEKSTIPTDIVKTNFSPFIPDTSSPGQIVFVSLGLLLVSLFILLLVSTLIDDEDVPNYSYENLHSSFENLLTDSIPSTFNRGPLYSKITTEMLLHHKWLFPFLGTNHSQSRILGLIILI